ncbi:MAG: molybdopterin-dependent oxidoreductase, partial [candidate division Zixibacteria bacterium]|nr:molybdopterin-dependent oxidoreductase [candidate division Zixibacteria bacterium]
MSLEWSMGQGAVDAFALMHGNTAWNYDLSHAEYVISFGLDCLQAFPSPVEASRAYGYLRRGRTDRRVRIVQVEPRRSVAGIKTDLWVPIKPGTEGMLALGMAHVLIAEEKYNRAFVERHTAGFEDWTDTEGTRHDGFKSIVMKDYTPGTVAAVTGIPSEAIVRLAHEFAGRKPALALSDRLRVVDQIAVHSLNILMGNVGSPGGVVPRATPSVFHPEEANKDITTSSVGLRASRGVLDVLTEADLDPLWLYRANPLFLGAQPDRWADLLERLPFIVSFSSFLDETALFADLILPESTDLETWQAASVSTLAGFPVWSVGKPATRPLYDTRHAGDAALEIARRTDLAVALPWENFETVVRESIRSICEKGKGTPLGGGEIPETEEDFYEAVV